MVRISIVTPTFNRRDMLVEALESVARQEWPDIEHIIVDGGSTDGTLDLVASRPDLRLIPGPDQGVYDALNKGIMATTGDVVGFLNSDDRFELGAFAAVAAGFDTAPDCDSVCGAARLVAAGETIEVYGREEDKELTSARTALLGASILNARFFRREALARLGPFSLDYCIVSDREFLMRAIAKGFRTAPIEALLYTYRRHHGSLSFSGEETQRPIIRRELLGVARHWASAPEASPETRRVARALEGRCLGRLVQTALREGHPANAWRLIFEGDRGVFSNLAALGQGLLDVMAAKITAPSALR